MSDRVAIVNEIRLYWVRFEHLNQTRLIPRTIDFFRPSVEAEEEYREHSFHRLPSCAPLSSTPVLLPEPKVQVSIMRTDSALYLFPFSVAEK